MPTYNKHKQYRSTLRDNTQEEMVALMAELGTSQGRVSMVADFLAFGAQAPNRVKSDRKNIYEMMLADIMSRKNQPLETRTFELCRAIATSQAEAHATQKVPVTIPTRFCQLVSKASRTTGVGVASIPTGASLSSDEFVYVSAMTTLFDGAKNADGSDRGVLGALQELWLDDKTAVEAIVNTVPMWEQRPSASSTTSTATSAGTRGTTTNQRTTSNQSVTPTQKVGETAPTQTIPQSWVEQNKTALLIGGGVLAVGGIWWYMNGKGAKRSRRNSALADNTNPATTLADGKRKRTTRKPRKKSRKH